MKKYEQQDQRAMATWAVDCAERVLPIFEKVYPQDDRPHQALEVCRTWVRTGVFKMAEIRGASLAAHAAARDAKEHQAACFAARAAGQAVATAHAPQHAFGGAYYALKAIAAAYPAQAEVKVLEERSWQVEHIPPQLRPEVLKRVIVQKRGDKVFITIQKDKDFLNSQGLVYSLNKERKDEKVEITDANNCGRVCRRTQRGIGLDDAKFRP